MDDLAVGDEGRDIEQALARAGSVPVHVPHDDSDSLRGSRLEAAQRFQGLFDEPIVLQQVHRRVSAEAQLGEHHQGAPGRPRPLGKGDDICAVALEIADRGVDLPAGDLHPLHLMDSNLTGELRG